MKILGSVPCYIRIRLSEEELHTSIRGCPACVEPIEVVGLLGKKLALELLAQLKGGAR